MASTACTIQTEVRSYVTQGRAGDLVGAPAVLGGWIAVELPRVLRDGQYYVAALLPACMDYGLEMSPLTLASAWAEEPE